MTVINFSCPQCATRYKIDETYCGKKGKCKKCGTLFVIEESSVAMPRPGITPWADGQVILDDFLVERNLGAGGMGAVYLVRSRSGGQQFAVKRTLVHMDASRRNFLAELQTWIDLPEHPHLARCRFFRTVHDEIVLFADFVTGGSLADWIKHRKLTSLDQILDVAIQLAWGLHAAHEAGVIHQDVKPANVLLTAEGEVRVADFGLARARARAGETAGTAGQSILVSAGGRTPAYCSPEQAEKKPLSRRTDVWSYGVSILEMFTGGVVWRAGPAAPRVLQQYLAAAPDNSPLPRMPIELARLLGKCFCREPGQRWSTLAELAEALRQLYRQVTGQGYARPEPVLAAHNVRAANSHDRRTRTGAAWDDPRTWLGKALEAEGRDRKEADTLILARQGSRRGQAIADLAAYEEVRRILERLVAGGRKDLETELATLCVNKAFVHRNLDDGSGAIALYDRAIAIYERLVEQEGRRELAIDLANACMNKAVAVSDLGDKRAAVALYDRAIAIRERLVEQEGRRELRGDLAWTILTRAKALLLLGERTRASTEAQQARAILRAEIARTERADLQTVLNWATTALKEIL